MKPTLSLASVIFFSQLNTIISFKLTILHTNDIHSRFEETNAFGGLCYGKDRDDGKCYGGAARRATIIKQIKAQEPNVMLLDAGDVFTGTLWYNVYRGNATWRLMNELKYDAMLSRNATFQFYHNAVRAFTIKHRNLVVVVLRPPDTEDYLTAPSIRILKKLLIP